MNLFDFKFSNLHLKQLMTSNKIKESQEYVQKFFFPALDKVFFFDGIQFLLYNRDEAKKLIASDCKVDKKESNDLTQKYEKISISARDYLSSSWFMETNYNQTVDFSREELVFTRDKKLRGITYKENYLNMGKPLGIDPKEPVKNLKKAKEDIKFVYAHIFEVLCSSNKELNEYFLNFLACTFGGRKLRTAIYMQSVERTGKGIIINDLLNKIMGDRMYKTGSIEEIIKYSKNFEGCGLLNFDELPSGSDFKEVQDVLKILITEPQFTCRQMHSSGYQQQNTFNIILTSNNNAVLLTQTNKERYVCMDVSEHRLKQVDYFKKIGDIVANPDVRQLFYLEMIERFKTLGNWNENNKPMTNTLQVKIIEGLPKLYKHIKETYILNNLDIDDETSNFLNDYKLTTRDNTTKNQIGRYLKKIGIEPKRQSNGTYKYLKTSAELLKIYKDNFWMDDLVDIVQEEEQDEQEEEEEEPEPEPEPIKPVKKEKKNKTIKKIEVEETEEDLEAELARLCK